MSPCWREGERGEVAEGCGRDIREVFETRGLVSGVKKVISRLVVDLQIRDVSGENGAWCLEWRW